MLTLIGMPVIQAPGEAEAQCAYLAKEGLAFGVVTEDMDTLTYGSPNLIRNFNKKCNIYVTIRKYSINKFEGTFRKHEFYKRSIYRFFHPLWLWLYNQNF